MSPSDLLSFCSGVFMAKVLQESGEETHLPGQTVVLLFRVFRHGDQPAETSHPERKPAGAANHRQHDAFSQHLSNQPPVSRPQRRANRQLPAPAGCPHQEQIGDVRAGNEQHEDHTRLENQKRCAHVSDKLIAKRDGVSAEAASFRKLGTPRQPNVVLIDDGFHLRIELLQRRPGAQPGDHHAELVATGAVGHLLWRESKWQEKRNVAPWQLEIRRQHANDAVGFTVQADIPADE